MEAYIETEGLSRCYGRHVSVHPLDLQVGRGEVLGLLGPNGAGKSTTMRMISGTLAPSGGRVRLCGIDLVERPADAKSRLGYLPEHPPLYPELTVDEFLRFCAQLRGIGGRDCSAAVEAAKGRCGLGGVGRRLVAHLSKGFQQRVGIAQAILHSPAVVILDEPTSALDPNQIQEIRTLIRELADGHALILSTHILSEVQATCDRVLILHQGRKVFEAPLAELRDRSHDQMVIRLAGPPALEVLEGIPGVAEIEPVSDRCYRLRLAEGVRPEQLAVQLTQWGLQELTPDHPSLERIFTHLTTGEDG